MEKMSTHHVEIKKEETIDIVDFVMCSKQTSTPNMENIDIKEEPMDTQQFSSAHERKKQSVFQQFSMEQKILLVKWNGTLQNC